MATLAELILLKLGLSEESKLQRKTTELLRLLELRSTNLPTQINDYGKIVLCIDIASSLLSIKFDKELALKLANLRKTQYANFKRLFEKLLDVNRLMNTKDICIQLGLSGINAKADELLALYDKIVASEDCNVDIKHPQYAAMAVFQACKIMKQKVLKPKIMSVSNLRPSQWALLEQRWDKFLLHHYNNFMQEKVSRKHKNDLDLKKMPQNIKEEKTGGKRQNIDEIEDYGKWKKRMLEMANAELQLLTSEIS